MKDAEMDVRRLQKRAGAQLLGAAAAASPAEVVERVVGVQAQDARAARLAVRARSEGLLASDVDAACTRSELVSTWLMRGTLHLVLASDVHWLLRIFGERNARAGGGRRRTLGLDDELCEHAFAALPEILRPGALPRDELVARLGEHGVLLDPRSQAPAHLLAYAASRGIVRRGPGAAVDEPTYALLEDEEDDRDRPAAVGPATDDDLAELGRRYAAGYGPTTPEDLAAWSGLPITVARKAHQAGAAHEPAVAQEPAAGPSAARTRLLGHFDCYLLGYAGRSAAVPAEHERAVHSGGGFIMPAVAVGGRVVATWSSRRRAGRLTVHVTPFDRPLPAAVQRALPGEVADLGRFLGVTAELAD